MGTGIHRRKLPRALAGLGNRRMRRASWFGWLGNASELPRSASTSPRSEDHLRGRHSATGPPRLLLRMRALLGANPRAWAPCRIKLQRANLLYVVFKTAASH